jgi:hypothetical protein
MPDDAKQTLAALAGQGSPLHKRHKIYLQIVGIAQLPYHYEERVRLMPMPFLTCWRWHGPASLIFSC